MLQIKFVCDVCTEECETKIELDKETNNFVIVIVPCKSCLNREYAAGAEAERAGMT